jgi:glyoxylase I family protein
MSNPPFEIGQLDHVVLRVRDVERAIRFYADVLGCREERRIEALGLYQLRAGSALIDLVAADSKLGQAGGGPPDREAPNVDHFALRVDPFDPTAICAHLDAHGARHGDVGERYGADGFGPSIYLKDPDGNTVELKGPPTRDLASESRTDPA